MDQAEVKVSEVKITSSTKKGKKTESPIICSYTYGTDLWKHVAGKVYECNIHNNQPSWIPYTNVNVINVCILKALICGFRYIQVPDTTDNGFVALWSSLKGDNDYLNTLKEIYADHSGECWKMFPSPNDLRKIAALQSSPEFVDKMLIDDFHMKFIDESLCEETELRKNMNNSKQSLLS